MPASIWAAASFSVLGANDTWVAWGAPDRNNDADTQPTTASNKRPARYCQKGLLRLMGVESAHTSPGLNPALPAPISQSLAQAKEEPDG
jgi:hypothetical protein